jgi:quinol monooxygenase YgiN
MVHVMATVQVESLERFLGVFATRGAKMRAKHGSYGATVFRSAEDATRLTLFLEFEERDDFDAFLDDPAVRETMKASGTLATPEFTFLELVAEFPS